MTDQNRDAQLTALRRQLDRRREAEAALCSLRSRRDALAAELAEQETLLQAEQADVARLEGQGLSTLFYRLTGRLEEQLEQEQQEATDAQVAYDAAAASLAETETELAWREQELAALADCEGQYRALLEEKADAIRRANGAAAAELRRRERRRDALTARRRELREASAAGNAALETTERALSRLDRARGWSTWDLVGGGLISDMAKHSHLDSAQAELEQLKTQLAGFRAELADVSIDAELQISIDGFLRFADYCFDGLIADWAVMDRIDRAREQMRSIEAQITDALRRLRAMEAETEKELSRLHDEWDALVWETRLAEGLPPSQA